MGKPFRGVIPVALAAVLSGWVLLPAAGAQPEVSLERGPVRVTRSIRIKPGSYCVADADGKGVLRIAADDVVVDFQGARLGATRTDGADLDRAEGTGIAVSGARNVTIRNVRVHGYRFNIRAVDAPGLRLENCDGGFSRAQRIARDGRPVNVWLHLRSLEAWRSYGAGFWIERCDGFTVRGCRASGAQNGLLVIDSAAGTVTECDFSFNSGWGLGLWHASRNRITWNRIDFVVRPWGGGWGGDSAALVVVNGASENWIVGNSLTHGGDGFFLTDRVNGGIDGGKMTTNIQGSSDRNLVALNDGSWSPCNAFEGTFSKGNVYYRNRADDSRYGFWLGYSDDSWLLENEILRNAVDGIAIEHGSGTRVEGNTFAEMGRAAIALWSSENWLDRLHPSRDIDIRGNVIRNCRRAFHLAHSREVSAGDNRITDSPADGFAFVERPASRTLDRFRESDRGKRLEAVLAARPKTFALLRDEPGPKGVDWIRADEFSPRDYRGRLVAWRERDACTIELLPLVSDALAFDAPDWLTREEQPGTGHWIVAAKPATGPGEVKEGRIVIRGAGRSQTVATTFVTATWDVRWFRWDRPRKLAYDDDAGWRRLFRSAPLHRQSVRGVSKSLWAGGFPQGVPSSHFALVAVTRIRLPGGRCELSTLSDDGIRVFLDGREVISRWNHHGPTPDRVEVKLRAGVHRFEIHYCQESGASALEFGWTRPER